MPRAEFEGRTAAEAAIKACDAFGVGRSQLKFEVLKDEGEGLTRVVRIVAEAEGGGAPASDGEGEREPRRDDRERPPREPRDRPEASGSRERRPPRRDDGGGGDRGGRGRRGGRGGRDRDDRGGRGGGRDRGDRGRGRRGGGMGRGPRDEGDGIEALLDLEAVPTVQQPLRAVLEGPGSDKAQKGLAVVQDLVRLSGLEVQAFLVQDDAEEVHFDLRGADEALAIGKKGETLLSLQFLVNRIISRDLEQEPVIVLDAANYRVRRRDALANLAKRLAARAVEEGKAVRLSPMSAHDRRVFHLTLKDVEEVETRSEGDGLYRHLLIIPAEYA